MPREVFTQNITVVGGSTTRGFNQGAKLAGPVGILIEPNGVDDAGATFEVLEYQDSDILNHTGKSLGTVTVDDENFRFSDSFDTNGGFLAVKYVKSIETAGDWDVTLFID